MSLSLAMSLVACVASVVLFRSLSIAVGHEDVLLGLLCAFWVWAATFGAFPEFRFEKKGSK
jgi:hypothetical protein